MTDVPPTMTWLGNTFALGGARVAFGTVLMILLYLGMWFWLRETGAGRHVYAVGNNPEATRLVGIPTERVLLGVYVLAGVFYGIASLLSVARTGVGDPNAGQTENLDAITAVVLGGTSLFGGRGIDPRLAGRRGRRRRAAQRPDADGRVVGLPGADHRHPGDPRRHRRPAFAQGRTLKTTLSLRCTTRACKGDTMSRTPDRDAGHTAWSSATARSPRSTAPTSNCAPARSSP